MATTESSESIADMSESVMLAIPMFRLGSWWFGPLRRVPVRVHFNPDGEIFWYADPNQSVLSTRNIEHYGGALIYETKERLWRTYKTRDSITRRVRRKSTSDQAAAIRTPSGPVSYKKQPSAVIEAVKNADGQVVVTLINEATEDIATPMPQSTTTSVFRARQGASASDDNASKRNTKRITGVSRSSDDAQQGPT